MGVIHLNLEPVPGKGDEQAKEPWVSRDLGDNVTLPHQFLQSESENIQRKSILLGLAASPND